MDNLPLPYTNYLYVKPLEKKSVLVSQKKTLFEVAQVLALGPEVKNTEIGEYVAFEHWDLPEIQGPDGNNYCFLKESDAICKFKVPQ